MAKVGVVEIEGEKIPVKEISAGQRRDLVKQATDNIDDAELNAQMIKSGCEKYKESSIEEILDLPGSDFDALAKEISKLSGMGGEAEKKA